MEGSKSMGRDG